MSHDLPFSQACENNRQPILVQLSRLLTASGRVLEIGSGTGQHAEYFSKHLPHLQWLPTDHPESLRMCQKRLSQAGYSNLEPPRPLDVNEHPWPLPSFDHAFSANTAHIMAWNEVCDMFRGLSSGIGQGGLFILYGPFRCHGRFTSDSNRRFHEQLQARAGHMGLRELDDLCELGTASGFTLCEDVAMPANNQLLVFRR